MNNQVIVIEYWRRTLEGREYCSNRLAKDEKTARKILILSGYKEIEEGIFAKGAMKAIITWRTVE